ncbi:uncharacterized protein LOC117030754 [Rhinolophus ferrumequinum]|uniref:uncharacterized protein LOC117030754 n=1 Tax=Rhinolophus ferrumequinum TaxID=59479 RepID=UPI00140F55B3|nr:uncharacterized protein LOC117030754 [Rhinolophus ferrumequinum]
MKVTRGEEAELREELSLLDPLNELESQTPPAPIPCAMLLLPPLLLLLRAQPTVTTSNDLISKQNQGPPSLTTQCVFGEYWTASHWCKCCPAGQYVSEPCRSPHTLGRCVKCDRGTFTAFPNGLDSCFPCATCSEDQEMVMECTSTRDRICRCKPGHFYELPDFYEFCRRCSRCPKGNVVLHKCNSTADTVCGEPDPGYRYSFFVLVAICLIVLISCAIILCYSKTQYGSIWAVCHRLRDGNGDRRENALSEGSVPLASSDGEPDADSSVLTTGNVSPSEDTLDVVSEAPTFTRSPESPAGVNGTQASAGAGSRAPDRSPQPDL